MIPPVTSSLDLATNLGVIGCAEWKNPSELQSGTAHQQQCSAPACSSTKAAKILAWFAQLKSQLIYLSGDKYLHLKIIGSYHVITLILLT